MPVNPLGLFFAFGCTLVVGIPVICRAIDGSWRPFVLGSVAGFALFGFLALFAACIVMLSGRLS